MTDPDIVDIVTLLRSPDRFEPHTCNAAADEIERLRARVIELEEKLNDAYAFIDRHESGLRALLKKVIAEEARKN